MINDIRAIFLSVRLISAFAVQTWFVPDEFWQSLEVAHKLSFGYGHLTWEWAQGIRSWLYPLSIAIVYKHLENFSLDHRLMLVYIPRLLQAALTAHSEWTFSKAISKVFDQDVAYFFIFLQTSSWYMFYTASRTLGNTFELNLILYGLSFYLHCRKDWLLLFCLISVYTRPTSGALWLPVMLIFIMSDHKWLISREGCKAMFKCSVILGLLVSLDSLLYGRWILVPFNFLKFNFFSNAAQFYGHHVWHWYFSNALPALMGMVSLALLVSPFYFTNKEKRKTLLTFGALCFSYVIFHSVVAHKEIRFLSPIVPVLNAIAAHVLVNFSFTWRRSLLACAILSNIPVGAYLSIVHQRGVLDVMDSITSRASQNDTILFLMPCHSTPFYSHIHINTTMRFLTCLPPGVSSFSEASDITADMGSYIDEADRFYANPINWLEKNINVSPNFIVLFDVLVTNVSVYLNKNEYDLRSTIFHSHVCEGRVGKNVLVFEKRNK